VFLEKKKYLENVSPKIQNIFTIVPVIMMKNRVLMMRTMKDFANLTKMVVLMYVMTWIKKNAKSFEVQRIRKRSVNPLRSAILVKDANLRLHVAEV